MIKKIVFYLTIMINIFLGIALISCLFEAGEKLKFEYVEQDNIEPESIHDYISREYYGTAAKLSAGIRGGKTPKEEDEDYYRLGEYTDLLFQTEIMKKAGNEATAKKFEEQAAQIRADHPQYNQLFDKIDGSLAEALASADKAKNNADESQSGAK